MASCREHCRSVRARAELGELRAECQGKHRGKGSTDGVLKTARNLQLSMSSGSKGRIAGLSRS